MTKSQLIRLLEDVPDDCLMIVEFPEGDSTNKMEVHSVVLESTKDNEISVVIRL